MTLNGLRICLVIDRLDVAGGPRVFEHLVTGLDPSQFHFTVATAPDSPLADIFRKNGARVVPVSFAKPLDPSTLMSLVKLFRRESFDIVHSMGLRADFHARLAAHWAGPSRVVSTVAMMAKGFDVPWWRRRSYQAAERISERWVHAFITDSEYARRQLIDEHGIAESKVQTIYIGADTSLFDPQKSNGARIRRELELGPGPLVGSLGRLVAQKGHDVFLEAVALAARSVPDLKAVVVGDGPLRSQLEERAQALGIAQRTKFVGARRDFSDLLSAVNVLVIASNLESIPVLLFEAMAMGRPIVATRVGGIPEIVEDGRQGILVSPENPREIAAAATRLLQDSRLAGDLGRQARERVMQSFQVRNCVDSVARFYRKISGRAN